ncbi:MAG: carboxypeptidase regulatory-like domain-containing protein [Dehalococcoidia bacterium]
MRAYANRNWLLLIAILSLSTFLVLASCADDADDETDSGTVSGTVTNSLTGGPVDGATVATDPAVWDMSILTDSGGRYSATLPAGTYDLTFERQYFESSTQTVVVAAGETTTSDVVLAPTVPVAVDAGEDQEGSPDGTVTLKVTVELLDSSEVTGYEWRQTGGVEAAIENAGSDSATVTLGGPAAYKRHLVEILDPIDRFMVLGVNPHSLEEAEAAMFEIAVTTSSGAYTGTVNVMAHLPHTVSTGLQNVAIQESVLLHGKTQDAYGWTLDAPSGSTASLEDASGQNPVFAPDVAGKYTLAESNSGASLEIYAGSWAGVITGQDANGEPVSDSSCISCHNDSIAPDKFTPWAASGHAEILAENLNTSTHYGEGCFACHTVGFNQSAGNGGIDEASDYAEFLDAGLINSPSPDNWSDMLSDYPETARLANIQCENCHGPQTSEAHMKGSPRTSLSGDVCGACHGEPPRHGRFQQWNDIAKHADYTLAVERGTSESCGRCHAAQGFLAWLPQLVAGNPGNIEAEITWTPETAEPVTCVVCHDPHAQGKTSGEPNTATVRVEGDTPMLPAGFKAVGVGQGAICVTCHNTRNGAHNDAVTTQMDDRAPHVAAQGDVLMGQNAYFVNVGDRSPHSFIEDSCANCHMVLTPPPAEFSYNLSGTNHSFVASPDICSNCHGAFDGGSLQESTHSQLEELKAAIEQAIVSEIKSQTAAGNAVTLIGFGPATSDVTISDGTSVTAVELTETHGRMAMDITIDSTKYEHVRLASDTTVKDGTLLSSDRGQTIAKAGWNYFLLHGDGSEGVHNPDFTLNVLNASIDALR